MIAYNNSNWSSVYQNLKKARMQWVMIVSVLEKMGAMVRAQGGVYKVVAQLVLLYYRGSLGGDGVDAKSTGGVPPPGGQADHGDDGDTWGGRGV